MKLFCFPYAGGSAMIYNEWKKNTNGYIEVVPVELPGRGIRFSEQLCDNMDELINKLYNELKKDFINEDYMFLGHSMGSLIVFYLASKILKEGIRQPSSLFFSGKEAPDILNKDEISYLMNYRLFIKKIYELGGTPKELLYNDELMKLFIPVLKNDYKLIETCEYQKPIKPFDCNITVLNGLKDKLTHEDIIGWRKFTSKKFSFINFDGDHFFIRNYRKEILNIIYDEVNLINEEMIENHYRK